MQNNYAFIEPTLAPDDWVLSGEFEQLEMSGQWLDFLPPAEYQRKYGVETSACVTFTLLNCLEILFKRVYGMQCDFCERYTAVCGSTTEYGADPQNVAETIRKKGVIAQKYLPFDETIKTWADFHSPTPMTKELLEIGEEWVEFNNFQHDWVLTPEMDLEEGTMQKILMDALTYSPLLVSVKAWKKEGDLYYKIKGERDNHATTLVGYKENEYWIVYDSYDSIIKHLTWDYDFMWAKRFSLKKKSVAENEQQELIEKLITLLQKLLKMLGF